MVLSELFSLAFQGGCHLAPLSCVSHGNTKQQYMVGVFLFRTYARVN